MRLGRLYMRFHHRLLGRQNREIAQLDHGLRETHDPLADKLLMTAAFVMLLRVPELRIPAWTIVAILAREFLVTGARSLAASEGTVIAANMWGKAKTVIQMIYVYAFFFLFIVSRGVERWAADSYELYMDILGTTSFWAIIGVAFFTAYSGLQFATANWKVLNLRTDS